MYIEARFKKVEKMNSEATQFLETAAFHAKEMYKRYENLTRISYQDYCTRRGIISFFGAMPERKK